MLNFKKQNMKLSKGIIVILQLNYFSLFIVNLSHQITFFVTLNNLHQKKI